MAGSERAKSKQARRPSRDVCPEAYADAYALAQRVFLGTLDQKRAEDTLTKRYDLGDRVAAGYIGGYLSMKRGSPKVRSTIAAGGWRFMLEQIEKDGPAALHRALSVFWEHIDYRSVPPGLRSVHADFLQKVTQHVAGDPAATLEDRVIESLRDSDEARRRRLDAALESPESVLIVTRAFRRNPDVIAEVLLRAAGVCEGCGREAPFKRPDGTPYLEVHHRKRLADGGADTVTNSIALCPNCHRDKHYGTVAGQ